jgi:hypothetical protein
MREGVNLDTFCFINVTMYPQYNNIVKIKWNLKKEAKYQGYPSILRYLGANV